MEEGRFVVQVGSATVDVRKLVRDIRGIEDMVIEAVRDDWAHQRLKIFNQRLYPFADAADIAEWDHFILERYPPLYTNPEGTCNDCPLGPCSLEGAKGKCGLELEAYQAKLSLRIACKGCLSQMIDSRELLNYAIKVFGKDKPVGFGRFFGKADLTSIGLLTGQYLKNLGDLDKAQSYAEDQLNKLLVASYQGSGTVTEFEELALHAGSLLFLTGNVAEFIKASLFGFTNAGDHEQIELINYPPPTSDAGLGSVEPGKPVLAFVGDSFLPAWVAVNQLKEKGLTGQIEVVGIGPAGDDGIRFYERFRNVGPIMQAKKIIRGGLADVIVASNACINLDILGEAERVESRVIWIGREQGLGLPDRTDDPADQIASDLIGGAAGAWIRDPEKAAEVAVKAVQGVKRRGDYVLSEEKVRAEAAKCRDDCDLCFSVCPNSLLLNKAVKRIKVEGPRALSEPLMSEVEKGCFFCGRCEEVCPGKIALLDLIVAAQQKRAPQDKFVMRAGRGMVNIQEAVTFAYSLAGNSPGFSHILGCGNANPDDLAWMANQLTSYGFTVQTAGCAATQIARYYDEIEQKFIFKKYPAEVQPRNLINCGGCSATHHLADTQPKWVRTGTYTSHYANFAETVDVLYTLWYPSVIIWGGLPERMYALAAGFARVGSPVIVGPVAGPSWKRFLMSDKWDWRKWWSYDILERRKKPTEPAKKHMIIPVETKEEAVTMLAATNFYVAAVSDIQVPHLESYLELHDTFFGEFPDDCDKFVRGPLELGLRFKPRMIKLLADKGWETGRLILLKARHPDGRLMSFEEFRKEYSACDGRAMTQLPHRVKPKVE